MYKGSIQTCTYTTKKWVQNMSPLHYEDQKKEFGLST